MAKWSFTCRDNSGFLQNIKVTAPSKPEAIEKAFKIAKSKAKGDISPQWTCRLISP